METKSLVMGTFFLILGLIELRNSVLNSFVLLTISAVYFRGVRKGDAYLVGASILAVCFAAVSLLSMLSSLINHTFFGEEARFEIGVLGFVALPFLRRMTRNIN